MAERYPLGILRDELGNPVGLREFPTGDTLPKSILPALTAEDVGAESEGTAQQLVLDLEQSVEDRLDTKVDKVVGKGLSTNDLTDALRTKLESLEGTHWRGTFPSLIALESGVTAPEAGDYADVDSVGQDIQRYIWDSTDQVWVEGGAGDPITAGQVKQLYESNPDTNAFTDADKAKLDSVAEGATANSTDAQLRDRSSHTGTQAISTVEGLQEALDGKSSEGDWIDLEPYLSPGFYFRANREGNNARPRARVVGTTVYLSGVVSYNETAGPPKGGVLFTNLPTAIRPKYTTGGTGFSDSSSPLWFGTYTWIIGGESGYGGALPGQFTVINQHPVATVADGAFTLDNAFYTLV